MASSKSRMLRRGRPGFRDGGASDSENRCLTRAQSASEMGICITVFTFKSAYSCPYRWPIHARQMMGRTRIFLDSQVLVGTSSLQKKCTIDSTSKASKNYCFQSVMRNRYRNHSAGSLLSHGPRLRCATVRQVVRLGGCHVG